MRDISYKEYRDDGKENNSHPPCFSELLQIVLEMHGVFIFVFVDGCLPVL